jgi:hypothetical protein
LYSSVLLVPVRSELTAHASRYIAGERTWTHSKHISRDRYPVSPLARRSDLQKHSFLYCCVTQQRTVYCLPGNLFTNTLPSNGCTCNNTKLLSDHNVTFDYKFNFKTTMKYLTLLKWICNHLQISATICVIRRVFL